jgi:uncharacterized protein (DUF934 family)
MGLIRRSGGRAAWAEDAFHSVVADEPVGEGPVILSLERFRSDGEGLLQSGRAVGVRLEPGEAVEALAQAAPKLALVALAFPKFRDGRAYSAALILRERLGFTGELRAVGEVLVEQAPFMIRCGFDAFEPADGSTPEAWENAAHRYRHVYQAAADGRPPAFLERAAGLQPAAPTAASSAKVAA